MVIVLHLANFAILLRLLASVQPKPTWYASVATLHNVSVCGKVTPSRESFSYSFLPPCDIIGLAPSRTKYCALFRKLTQITGLIVTLNLGDCHLQLLYMLISSPMNTIHSKTARLAPIQSDVRIRQPGHRRAVIIPAPYSIVIQLCLTWQYSTLVSTNLA